MIYIMSHQNRIIIYKKKKTLILLLNGFYVKFNVISISIVRIYLLVTFYTLLCLKIFKIIYLYF